MNTTTAARTAGVTPGTVASWCRNGVITAVKQAGRWIIEQASLAHRIALAALKTRKASAMDLTATLTATYTSDIEPTTITPKISTRVRDGATITVVRNIAPLLADHLDTIADETQRLHTIETLRAASITIRDTPTGTPDGVTGLGTYRDHGRLATTYQGSAHLTAEQVLDLAAAIRAHLA